MKINIEDRIRRLKINCAIGNKYFHNGYEYVDLGLPSCVNYAKCNVGAENEWESGMYFSWGNCGGHYNVDICDFSRAHYKTSFGDALTSDIVPMSEHDMAHANLGGKWRLPTDVEFKELLDNCTNVWINQNGINGIRFTSNINGNSIFIPAAGFHAGATINYDGLYGYYWTNRLHNVNEAHILYLYENNIYTNDFVTRYYGLSVRAVYKE